LLIRRSQVQVLAGPPPIVAGQSAAGSEPGVLAAGLGRAGAARRSPPAPPVALRVRPPGRQARPRPPTVVAPPARGRQPRGMRPPGAAPAPVPTAQPPAPPRPAPNSAAGVRYRPPADQRDCGSVARVPASWTVVEPSTARQPPVPGVRVARPRRPGPQRHRLRGGDGRVRTDEGRHQTAGHRTGGQQTAGQQTAGRWTAGHQTSGRVDSRRPSAGPPGRPPPGDRTPDGWTAGSRTPKPDGWTPPAGHRRPTPWRACWPCQPRRQRRPLDTGWTLLRADAVWASNNPGPLSSKDAEGTHAATDGSGHRRDRQLQVVRRRPAGASAHCSPRKRLGSRVARDGDCHPLWRVRLSVDGGQVERRCCWAWDWGTA
jgi:hypothetical protein